MKILLTARHCEVNDEIRERAELVMQRAAKRAHRPQRAEVVFDIDHNQHIVELQLYVPKNNPFVATAEAVDFRTALDRAEEKLRKQLDKSHPASEKRAAGF